MSGGFAILTDPTHLLEKLRHDLERMRRSPVDAYAAFDFFVTARHMQDWMGWSAERKRRAEDPPLREIVREIAEGAKHFHPAGEHLDGPIRRGQTGGYDPRAFDPRAFAMVQPALLVDLTGPAAAAYGRSITTIALAKHVLAYWEREVAAAPTTGAGDDPTGTGRS